MFRAVDEVGATLNAALVVMGDKLGLYRALAGAGPLTPVELARRAGVARALRPRVAERAGGGRLRRVRPGSGQLHAPAGAGGRADRRGEPRLPAGLLPDRARQRASTRRASPRRRAAATGVGWHEHDHDVFEGCERFFRPGYNANLLPSWLPALDGVVEKLERGRARSPTSAAATAPRRS